MRPQRDWTEDIRADARAAGWWREDAAVVAAVSGGPDSMALLHLLKTMAEESPFRIVVAHADHQFRGAESAAEAETVRRTAEEWGLAFETAKLALPAYIEETGANAQEAARERRYAFLAETARKEGASWLLTAHHADDQAETVLMRVIRGTGVGGLAGIPFRRKADRLELIRPFLRITKCELLDYCKRNGVSYSTDSSNAERHYFRNAVRLDVMPMLEAYNPKLKASLARLADLAAADDDYLQERTRLAFREGVAPSGDGFLLERRRFRGLHVALQRRLIKLILNCSSNPRQMLDFRQVDDMISALAQERPSVFRMDIGDGWVLRGEYEQAYVGPEKPDSVSFTYIVADATGELLIAETGDRLRFERLEGSIPGTRNSRTEAAFDADRLRYPLLVRSRKPGDNMQPYGLNGTKKVQDMFVDAKVPRSRRDRIPLLVDGEGRVLWIPGMRRSSHAPVDTDTRTTLRIAYAGAENGGIIG
ncbi:tRNA lysidine(34) synthetase TilS [Paenibacillaceae bacterium WGS1546]|uniref:tRNA lysidine(34) synthetase TilS n=1 Tax=Cohnella sp. WGS1546 TaxID=3366810 RepID=UPI00372D4DD3